MRIFILGAGEVGFHIASSLAREGHDLVVIERDAEKVRRIEKTLDVLAVAGDGCNPEILRSRGIEAADLFFSVSNDDASNLLAALTARRLGARRCVVRTGEPFHDANPLLAGDERIVLLHPERLVAAEILSLTRVPGVSKARFFAEDRLVLVQVRPSPDAPIYGTPLRKLPGIQGWVLTGIRTGTGLVIPGGDTVLRPGWPIYAVGRTETIGLFLESLGVESRPARKVVIAGAGHVGGWLSRLLVKKKLGVTVIQRGGKRAFDLAAAVPKALVLQGDATDPAMLREAGVEDADYFVAATQDDESNILSSLLARELGVRTVVALYHRPEFLNVLRAARIDLPISPRLVVAGTILRMVHGREILTMDLLEGGDAEVVEFHVPPRARVLRRPLRHLSFPGGAIVGAVIRDEEIHVPAGDFSFREGDRALVFLRAESLANVEKMFEGR